MLDSSHHQKQRGKAKAKRFPLSGGTRPVRQPPTEKPNACANDPNPPRVTPPEPASDEAPDGERPDELSPPKKLLRDDDPPDQPWLPPDDDPWGGHSAGGCKSDAIPGRPVAQFSLGMWASSPPPP